MATKKTKRFDSGGTAFGDTLSGMRDDIRHINKQAVAAEQTADSMEASRAGRKYYPTSKWDDENAADETAKETAHLAKLHPNKGRGIIDTSSIDEKTLLPKKMAKGGTIRSASSRADGIAIKGKTRGKMY
jgi:hypothetical protein